MLHARFVCALPYEYSLVKETLQSIKNRNWDEINRMVSTPYSNLPQKKGAQRSSRSSMHSSPAKAAAVAVRNEVAAAAEGADGAADAAKAAAMEEVTATATEIPVVV